MRNIGSRRLDEFCLSPDSRKSVGQSTADRGGSRAKVRARAILVSFYSAHTITQRPPERVAWSLPKCCTRGQKCTSTSNFNSIRQLQNGSLKNRRSPNCKIAFPHYFQQYTDSNTKSKFDYRPPPASFKLEADTNPPHKTRNEKASRRPPGPRGLSSSPTRSKRNEED